jgi:hypothetical protein
LTFKKDITQNPRSGFCSGQELRPTDINAFLIEILEPEIVTYHIDNSEEKENCAAVNTMNNNHLAQISDDKNPSNIQEAHAIPAFAKVADDKMK